MKDDLKQFGNKVKFEVCKDLLEYEITWEIKRIAKEFDIIYTKTNSTILLDLLENIYNSVDIKLLKEGDRK